MKLPKNASKEERREAHRRKMMGKFFRKYEFGSTLTKKEEDEVYGPQTNQE